MIRHAPWIEKALVVIALAMLLIAAVSKTLGAARG